jgi:hypothetical protein
MKRFVVFAVLTLAVALVASGTASARPQRQQALSPAEKSLQKQVTALSKSVTTLQKKVVTLNKDLTSVGQYAQAVLLFDECSNAITADTFQGTWTVIDQLASATQAGKTYFGPQTPVDDKNLCSAGFGITRSQVTPPTVAGFSSLLNIVTGSAALARRVTL